MNISLITRADDLGSSHAANLAIAEAVRSTDYIKNVSCMAVGPLIEESVELLKGYHHICFGLHATLNAEWDLIKWCPLSPPEQVPSLVTAEGFFYNDPSMFLAHPPEIEQILLEYDRQLDLLTRLGMDIRYVDSHMLPELVVEGLSQAMSDWIRRKGLIDHILYYRFPSKMEPGPSSTIETGLASVVGWFDLLKEGVYFSVMHPARYSRELFLYRNKQVPDGQIATWRDVEYQLLISRRLEQACDQRGIKRVRYDEAEPMGITFQQLQQLFSLTSKEPVNE